ncbi:MAG TPA: hypothetical protein DEG43_03485 [Acidimicrobiaceae bacterium]|nr:hypothetical protein [Acidimicrobiaceae bacterium]
MDPRPACCVGKCAKCFLRVILRAEIMWLGVGCGHLLRLSNWEPRERSLRLCALWTSGCIGRTFCESRGFSPTMVDVLSVRTDDLWAELTADTLEPREYEQWLVVPSCGAVVSFLGVARDHSEGRPGVSSLEFEAYESQVIPKLVQLAEQMRRTWPEIARIALIHRTGILVPTEPVVFVGVSHPHRRDAFAATEFGIDSLKASVPIWKQESWEGGRSWGLEAQHLEGVDTA